MNEKTLKEILLKIIYFSTIFLLFSPLLVHNSYFFPFVSAKAIYINFFCEIIFFCWLILAILDPKYRPNFNILTFSLFLYFLFLILSSVFAVNPTLSFWSKFERMTGLILIFHFLALYLALSSTFEKEEIEKFFATSVFVAMVCGLDAILRVGIEELRGGGTLGNESFLGTYLLFNIFFAIYIWLFGKKEMNLFGKISTFILVFLIFFAGVKLKGVPILEKAKMVLWKSGARAAKLSLVAGLFSFPIFSLCFSKSPTLKKLGIFSSFSIFIFLFIFSVFFSFSPIFWKDSFGQKIIEKITGENFGGRFPVWKISLKCFFERPFFGWGPENFELCFTKYFDPCFFSDKCGQNIWYDRAHNFIFDHLVSSGIFGLISFIFIFISALFVCLKEDYRFFPLFFSLFLSYFLQNLTVFDMPVSYLMIFLTLSFIGSLKKKPYGKPINVIYALPLLPIYFSFFYYFVFLPNQTATSILKAISFPPGSFLRISSEKMIVSPVGKYQNWEFLAENITSFLEEKPTSEIWQEINFLTEKLEETIKECPLCLKSHLALGSLYFSLSYYDISKLDRAEQIFKKAIQASPSNQQGYWGLANVKLKKGEIKEALELAEKALSLEPDSKKAQDFLLKVKKFSQ